MQPAQLSLLPDLVRAPAPLVLTQVAEQDLDEAVRILGALIANALPIVLAGGTAREAAADKDE
jgi:hypothetical protein